MCVILACEDEKPSLDILESCECANADGAGIAWFDNTGKASYKKNMTAKELDAFITDLPLPYVIHFRLASVGGKNPLLTHPFEVSIDSPLRLEGSADKLLVHNGHINDWDMYLAAAGIDTPEDKSPMSDSRAIAMIISKNNEKFLDKLRGNYVLIDATKERFRLFGHFTKENGIYYSNMIWKYRTRSISSSCFVNQNELKQIFQGKIYGIPFEEFCKLSKKQQKRVKRAYHRLFNLGLSDKEQEELEKELDEELNESSTKIHATPEDNPLYSDNTRKILGLPFKSN